MTDWRPRANNFIDSGGKKVNDLGSKVLFPSVMWETDFSNVSIQTRSFIYKKKSGNEIHFYPMSLSFIHLFDRLFFSRAYGS